MSCLLSADFGVQNQTWIDEILGVSTVTTKYGMQGIISYANPWQEFFFSRGREEF